jgi:hypothetical protein
MTRNAGVNVRQNSVDDYSEYNITEFYCIEGIILYSIPNQVYNTMYRRYCSRRSGRRVSSLYVEIAVLLLGTGINIVAGLTNYSQNRRTL